MGDDEARLRDMLTRSGADWLVAACPGDAVELVRARDHHVVTVGQRRGVLLTYHLWADVDAPRAYVLFAHVDGHPDAPDELQRAVDDLDFRAG